MRRVATAFTVLLLAVCGFLYQIRLSGSLPGMRDMLPLLIGVVMFAAVSFVFAHGRIRMLMEVPWLHYAIAAVLLLALAAFGRRYRGGLYLFGRINPSEFVKVFFVLFAAAYLARARAAAGCITLRTFAVLAAAFGLLALEIALIRDFGLLAQLGMTLAALLFAVSWGWGVAAFAGVAVMTLTAMAHPVGHLATRFSVWLDPFTDMTGAGWQTLQGLAALVSGGWWGKGIGLGEVHAVPIVSSDFIYAALAEEIGFAGCALLLLLCFALFVFPFYPCIRCQNSAKPIKKGVPPQQKTEGFALLVIGIVASLGIQLVLNVAGVLNVLPMTGITFPLLSHGGCSLIAVLLMYGLLIACSSTIEEISDT